MYKSEETLDDLMNEVLVELLQRPFDVSPSRGTTSEIIGALLHLKNPRARLSRTETKGTIFSALGELLWYLSKKNDLGFIAYYLPEYVKDSPDGETIFGAYGPRLFNLNGKHNQVFNVINLLMQRPNSRKAVIQLFDAEDIADDHKEIPCTCTLQFIIRQNKLHMFTSMRSNDAFFGLPHDVFAFTMLQEILARTLSVEVGEYNHAVGSLHLYESKKERAIKYLKEGFQPTKLHMPPMPLGDPWPAIKTILDFESTIRNGEKVEIEKANLDPYWADLVRLLEIYSFIKNGRLDLVEHTQNKMTSSIYNAYIKRRLDKLQGKAQK